MDTQEFLHALERRFPTVPFECLTDDKGLFNVVFGVADMRFGMNTERPDEAALAQVIHIVDEHIKWCEGELMKKAKL